MKTVKVKFKIGTGYVGSDKEQIVDIQIEEEWTEEEVDDYIKEIYEEWVWQNVDSSYNIIY